MIEDARFLSSTKEVAALYVDKLYIVIRSTRAERSSAHTTTLGRPHEVEGRGRPADGDAGGVSVKYADPITNTVCRDLHDENSWIYSTSRYRAHAETEVKRLPKTKGEKA
jgi:hypothetical protein